MKKIDLTGQKFGNWIVIGQDKTKKTTYWLCKCNCKYETIKSIRANHLKDNSYKHKCDKCLEDEKNIIKNEIKNQNIINKENKYKKLIGKQFGNLLVKKFYGYNKNKSLLWLCECQCENKTQIIASSTDLTTGKKDNCGCLTSLKRSQSKRRYNTYNLKEKYGIGYTLKNEEFYFDLEDYDKIKDYCWYIHKNSNNKNLLYVEAKDINSDRIVKLHRLIMDVSDKNIKVDHINHKGYDNRKNNLRKTTNQQNCMNHLIHSNNTSGESGISYRKDLNKWRARIWYKGMCYNLGSFLNFEDAVKARKEAEIKYFGEYRIKDDVCHE